MLKEIVGVEKHDRLAVEPHLLPSEHLEHFFNGAEAARKSNCGVGKIGHDRLAFVHGINHVELSETLMGHFPLGDPVRKYAGDSATCFQNRVSQQPHESDRSTAIDEFDVSTRERTPEQFCLGLKRRDVSNICTAIHNNSLHGAEHTDGATYEDDGRDS